MKKLFGLILMLIAGTKLAHSSNLPNKSLNCTFRQTEQSKNPAQRRGQRTPSIHQYALNNVAPAYRSQTQRSGSTAKIFFASVLNTPVYHNTLVHIFLQLNAGYVRWCKLVLFPFHDFW